MTPARTHLRTGRLAALLLAALLTFGLAACGGNEAPAASAPAAGAAAESAAEGAAPAIAMADRPQKLTPVDFVTDFSGADYQLIDVRTPEEFASGHIDGAINIPVDQIGGRIDEVASDKPVVLYCRSGNRSNQAASILDQAGRTGIYDLGGVIAWQEAGLPLQQGCVGC